MEGAAQTTIGRARALLAEMLERIQWQYFGTFTFRGAVDLSAASREFEQKYVSRLQQRTQCKVGYFAVVGKGSRYERVHIHALLISRRFLRRSDVQEAWNAGGSVASRYDRRRGAARYVARHAFEAEREVLVVPLTADGFWPEGKTE